MLVGDMDWDMPVLKGKQRRRDLQRGMRRNGQRKKKTQEATITAI